MTSFFCLLGAPEGIRTPDLPVRSRTLYPAELRVQTTSIVLPSLNFVKDFFCAGACAGARQTFKLQMRKGSKF